MTDPLEFQIGLMLGVIIAAWGIATLESEHN